MPAGNALLYDQEINLHTIFAVLRIGTGVEIQLVPRSHKHLSYITVISTGTKVYRLNKMQTKRDKLFPEKFGVIQADNE